MDREQEQPRERGGRTIAIHIHVTSAAVALASLLAVCMVIAAVVVATARAGGGEIVAGAADQAGAAGPAAPESYPAPPAAGFAVAPTLAGAPTEPPPPTAAPAAPEPAAGLGEADGLAQGGPVGLGEPPVFDPTRTLLIEPTAVQPAAIQPAAIEPTATAADLVLDLDPLPPPPPPAAPAQAPAEPSPTPSGQQPAASPLAAAAAAASSGDAPTAAPPTAPPAAPPPPMTAITGAVRWSPGQSPIFLRQSHVIPAGSSLTIEPGVEVLLDAGVSINVGGALIVQGTPDRPVRFSRLGGQPWGGIFATAGSRVAISSAQLRAGGAGGTLIAVEGGLLQLSNVSVRENFGQIRADDSAVDVQGLEMAANRIPYGAALQAAFSGDGTLRLLNSRIAENRLAAGGAGVQIGGQGGVNGVGLDVRGNLISGDGGPALEIIANTTMAGEVVCNALSGGATGLSLLSDAPVNFDPGLKIAANAIEGQTPPIIPFYLEHGIGRGATSALPLDMRDNWWESPLGPYAPDTNAAGRGEAVGPNISFAPWLGERPPCAPR